MEVSVMFQRRCLLQATTHRLRTWAPKGTATMAPWLYARARGFWFQGPFPSEHKKSWCFFLRNVLDPSQRNIDLLKKRSLFVARFQVWLVLAVPAVSSTLWFFISQFSAFFGRGEFPPNSQELDIWHLAAARQHPGIMLTLVAEDGTSWGGFLVQVGGFKLLNFKTPKSLDMDGFHGGKDLVY